MKEPKLTPEERRLLDRLADGGKRKRVRLHDEPLPVTVIKPVPNNVPKTEHNLTMLEERFVHEYTKHYDMVRAAIDAGYPPSRSTHYARTLLKDRRVKDYLAQVEANRLKRLRVDGDYLLNRILQIALADPNELVEVWIPPCRYCWGKNSLFQYTHAEMEGRLEAFQQWRPEYRGDKRPPFDEEGGSGYDIDQPPNPQCPNCKGRGNSQNPIVHYKDSRFLSPDGRALYAGAESTRNGFKFISRNQDAAWGFLAKFAERWLEGQGKKPVTFDPEQMTTEDLDSVLEFAQELGLDDDDLLA